MNWSNEQKKRNACANGRVERAQYEADLAQRRYLKVDPANRLVASVLEAEWNAKLRELEEARASRASSTRRAINIRSVQRNALRSMESRSAFAHSGMTPKPRHASANEPYG
jgi:hypothetical protein